jgi:hypothetical protein
MVFGIISNLEIKYMRENVHRLYAKTIHTTLCKGLEHLHILVFAGGSGTNPPQILNK